MEDRMRYAMILVLAVLVGGAAWALTLSHRAADQRRADTAAAEQAYGAAIRASDEAMRPAPR
jgi:hypothetical protein